MLPRLCAGCCGCVPAPSGGAIAAGTGDSIDPLGEHLPATFDHHLQMSDLSFDRNEKREGAGKPQLHLQVDRSLINRITLSQEMSLK